MLRVFLSRPSSVLPCSSRHAYSDQAFPGYELCILYSPKLLWSYNVRRDRLLILSTILCTCLFSRLCWLPILLLYMGREVCSSSQKVGWGGPSCQYSLGGAIAVCHGCSVVFEPPQFIITGCAVSISSPQILVVTLPVLGIVRSVSPAVSPFSIYTEKW